MLNLKTYEQLSEHEDYIIALPSGQVIDMMKADAMRLGRLGLCVFDYDRTKHFVCDDVIVPVIYEYLWRDKTVYNKKMIEQFMKDIGFERDQFRVFDDLSVDAYGPVNITYRKLFKIPFKFNRCSSDFNCSYNMLLTLANSPHTVHGNFNCSYNCLPDLKGGPRLVSKSYNCSHNKLTGLYGAPDIVNYFDCSFNNLKNLVPSPKVKGIMICHNNSFTFNEVEKNN
jgi:hypothetical protein